MTRASSIDAASRSEPPLTCIIFSSLEHAFAQARMRRRSESDALAMMSALLSEAARERATARARAILRTRQRSETLERAVSSMGDVDLDAAWRAALRGDTLVTEARMLPHVQAPLKPTPKGSPWRGSGWLSKR